jgi:hypothetical protein
LLHDFMLIAAVEAALVPAPRTPAATHEDWRTTPLVALPSQTVLDELRGLEAQLACFRDFRAQLEASYGTGNTEQALEGARGLRRATHGLATTYVRLRRHVLAFDAAVMGDKIGSFGELAIRAQTLFVAAQLNELAHAIDAERQAPAAANRGEALFTGNLRCVDDVASLFCDAFARINAIWLPYRAGGVHTPAPGASVASQTERAARYRNAICDAQRALSALGDEPTIASFLRAGAARTDWPAVHSACGRITLALQISLAGEPELSPPEWADEPPATYPCSPVASER